MDSNTVLGVGSAVSLLTQVIKWSGLPDRFAPVAVMALAALGVGVWEYSTGSISRVNAFDIFSAWITITASSAGVFGFVKGTVRAVQTGTGGGTTGDTPTAAKR